MRRVGLQLAGALVAAGTILVAWVLPRPAAGPAAETRGAAVPSAAAAESLTSTLAPAPPARAGSRRRARHASAERVERVLARRLPAMAAHERGRLASAILDEARVAALDPLFVLAVIAVESGFDHGAESVRGARGLMQLRPSTLEREKERSKLEGDLEDPVLNVRAGVRYYARLLRAFGDHDTALMAYNAGPNRILRYMREEGEIPARFHSYPRRVQAEMSRLQGAPAVDEPRAEARSAATPREPAAPSS